MIRLTRHYRFSASHRLHSVQLSDAENRALYGKCNNPYGHGHDYVLEVSVRGPLDERTGRVVDLGTLDALVRCEVLGAFDHKDLNSDIPEFSGVVPTTENLVAEVERRLRRGWRAAFPPEGPALDRIRILETRRNAFEARF